MKMFHLNVEINKRFSKQIKISKYLRFSAILSSQCIQENSDIEHIHVSSNI